MNYQYLARYLQSLKAVTCTFQWEFNNLDYRSCKIAPMKRTEVGSLDFVEVNQLCHRKYGATQKVPSQYVQKGTVSDFFRARYQKYFAISI